MASPAHIIRSCLYDLRLVDLPGIVRLPRGTREVDRDTVWCLCDGFSDEYDRALLIEDQAGMDWGREMNGGRRHVHPGLRFTFRHTDPVVGFNKANAIVLALDQQILMVETTLPEDDTVHYVHAVKRTTTLISLGEEKGKRRYLWSLNARVSFQDREPTLG